MSKTHLRFLILPLQSQTPSRVIDSGSNNLEATHTYTKKKAKHIHFCIQQIETIYVYTVVV